jgi:replicative DNA helicase
MNDEYETALLGAILAGYPDIPSLMRIVSRGDFNLPRHADIWTACLAVHARGEQPNPLTVRDQMGSAANHLPKGPLYLAELSAPVPAQAPFYARKVRDLALRRQISDLGVRCQQLLLDDDAEPADLIERIRGWADNIRTGRGSRTVTAGEAFERVIDIAENGEPAALPTAWKVLDDLLGGWYPGQLIVIGGRPGKGKSILLENAATVAARHHGRRVLFVSMEMSEVELTQRTAAWTAGVNLTNLRRGGDAMTEQDWRKLRSAAATMTATPMDIHSESSLTVDQIRSVAWDTRQQARRNGEDLGLIVVDYLQLIQPRDRKLTRQQQLGEVSRGLKALAGEMGVPVIAAAQLSRDSSGRIPVLSDLRESGDIEQDADVVLLLHEVTEQDQHGKHTPTGELVVYVAKQRQGQLGEVSLYRYGHYGRLSAA